MSLPGVTSIPAGLDLSIEIASAIEEWERLTGCRPFEMEDTDSTRFFDPSQSRILFFRPGPYVSVTSITVGVVPSSSGQVLTLNTDYFLQPYNAPENGRPFTSCRFSFDLYGSERSIKVIGRRGWAEQIPARAYQAVLKKVAAEALSASRGHTGQIDRIKQGPVEIEYSAHEGADTVSQFRHEFECAARAYAPKWM